MTSVPLVAGAVSDGRRWSILGEIVVRIKSRSSTSLLLRNLTSATFIVYNYTEFPTKDVQRLLLGPIIDHIDHPCLVKLELARNPENGNIIIFCYFAIDRQAIVLSVPM